MIDGIYFFKELIQSGSFFWFCALVGSAMLVIQLLLNFFGLANDAALETTDMASEYIQETAHDSTESRRFKWLSMQAITAFLLMFGWTAITCQDEFHLHISMTIGISVMSASFTLLMIRSIFQLASRLKSSGTIYKIEEAVGQEGIIYHRIPKGGRGKISLSLHHFTHEIDAISAVSEELPSFMRVKIIGQQDDATVIVTPL